MSNQSSHWPKATALALEAFHHPSSYDHPPFPVKPVTLVSQSTPQYISKPSPLLHIAWRIFHALLSLHSQFKIPKTIKIPGPLQFAGFVPTFEILLIRLLTGHLSAFLQFLYFLISWCIKSVALPLFDCVALKKLFNFSNCSFLICKLWLITLTTSYLCWEN